ncbi:hypothetical protein KEM56_005614 [Ascosphaera pollenicola]|nr:hypothetical protein KEM56_005614 [Ascosphaera pollenicola]
MSKPTYRHTIHALRGDTHSITKAARTTSLSFDADHLIRWLRPNGSTWGNLDVSTNRWQYRRFQSEIWNARIVHASTKLANAATTSAANGKSSTLLKGPETSSSGSISNGKQTTKNGYTVISIEEDVDASGDEEEDYSGVAILYPPKEYNPSITSWRGLSRWAMGQYHSILDVVSPIKDDGADMERLILMMIEHDAKAEKYKMQLAAVNRKLWYLEVCCVRPSMQGKGTARALMEWVLKQVGGDACYLECTEEANVPFYEKFGFDVYEVVRLTHKSDDVKLYMMIKQ